MGLFYHFCFGQTVERKSLHGRAINDSIRMESGYVDNITSKTRTFISQEGFFDLLAKENDTLLLTGLTFDPKRVILSQEDLSKKLLIVKLKAKVNMIEEVLIDDKLKPNMENIQAILGKKYFDDAQSSPKNRLMPPDGSIENGIDFVRIIKGVFKLFKSKKPPKTTEVAVDFTEGVVGIMKPAFFINTLKLNEDQIGLFLIFCGNDPKSQAVIKSNSEFELMDFLISKKEGFKANLILKK